MPCFVGYLMELDGFLQMFGLTIEEAAARAKALGITTADDMRWHPEYNCANKYMLHMLSESGTEIECDYVDKGAMIFGIPLDKKVKLCALREGTPISLLVQEVQRAQALFFQELGKIGQLDLSAVCLSYIDDQHPPQAFPEPRLLEWDD